MLKISCKDKFQRIFETNLGKRDAIYKQIAQQTMAFAGCSKRNTRRKCVVKRRKVDRKSKNVVGWHITQWTHRDQCGDL